MDDVAVTAAFALGFLSGFRHAFEADHVIAISAMVHREPSVWRALRLGAVWGLGHTTMLVLAVLVVAVLRLPIHEEALGFLELPVAVMLVVLGAWAVRDAVTRIRSLKRHEHDAVDHYHVGDHAHPHDLTPNAGRTGWQGYSVGLVHGLAGSGALLLLVAATLPTPAMSVLYAATFGVGSVLGMGLVTAALAVPLLRSGSRPTLRHTLTGLAGALSIVLGASIIVAFV